MSTSFESSDNDDEQCDPYVLRKVHRRKTSPRSSSGTALPSWVSMWKLFHVERHLNIYYDKSYSASQEVLRKIPNLKGCTEQQKEYINYVQNFLDIDSNFLEYKVDKMTAKNKLDEMSTRFRQAVLTGNEIETIARVKVNGLILTLHRLWKDMHQQREERRFPVLCEGLFTELIHSFGELCCLEVVNATGRRSHWKNLRGVREVISEPDCRFFKIEATADGLFYKLGLNNFSEVKPNSIVSVVEVTCGKKRGSSGKRRRDSSSSSSCSSEYRSSPQCEAATQENYSPPELMWELNRRILGQHAGKLLLDLHAYPQFLPNDDGAKELLLPGLIVDGTMVFMTLLVISKEHFNKLEGNSPLENSERAVIYYTKPLDILVQNDRNTLLENLMTLNNN